MSRLLEVKNLSKFYTSKQGFFGAKSETVKAVNQINFHVDEQETLGIVGESGCGKSTTGRAVLRLHEPTEGEILYRGKDICKLSLEEMKPYRQKMQIVFQNANSALDPRWTVEQSLAEPIRLHYPQISQKELDERIDRLMEEVGFAPMYKKKYPHEFSGGQRQRIGIAKAISVSPEFVVCDEPVSALDVSIQAQILNLMQDLQEELNLTYMFITHDLSVVRHFSNNIVVMYLGQMVECAPAKTLFKNPLHPYTKALLSAIPVPDPDFKMERIPLKGELTSPINPDPGCRFAKRCPYATEACTSREMTLMELEPEHFVSCRMIQEQR